MEFIQKYAWVDRSDYDENDEMISVSGGDEVRTYSDEEFIDNKSNVQDQDPPNYCLMNVTRDLQEVMQDDSMAQELYLVCSDPENFVSDYVEKTEYEYDEFVDFEKRIKKFEHYLKIFEMNSKDSFFTQSFMAFIILC